MSHFIKYISMPQKLTSCFIHNPISKPIHDSLHQTHLNAPETHLMTLVQNPRQGMTSCGTPLHLGQWVILSKAL